MNTREAREHVQKLIEKYMMRDLEFSAGSPSKSPYRLLRDELLNDLHSLQNALTPAERKRLKVIFGPEDLPDHNTSGACGLAHKSVEAGGLWYCPNYTCKGAGNSYFRKSNLKSYRDVLGSSQHEVDTEEWYKVALEKRREEKDIDIASAVDAGLRTLRTNIHSAKFGL